MRIFLGKAWEGSHNLRGRMEIYGEKRDAWMGAFIAEDAIYVCPLPFLVIRVSRGRRTA